MMLRICEDPLPVTSGGGHEVCKSSVTTSAVERPTGGTKIRLHTVHALRMSSARISEHECDESSAHCVVPPAPAPAKIATLNPQ